MKKILFNIKQNDYDFIWIECKTNKQSVSSYIRNLIKVDIEKRKKLFNK